MNINLLNQLELHDVGVDKIELDTTYSKVSIGIKPYDEITNDYYNQSLLFYGVQNLYFNGLIGELTHLEIYSSESNKINETLYNITFTLISTTKKNDMVSVSFELKFQFTSFEINP